MEASIDSEAVRKAFEKFPSELIKSINIELKQIGAEIESEAFKSHKHEARSGNLQDSPFSSVGEDGLTVTLDPENLLPYAEWIHDDWGDPFLYEAFNKEKPNAIKKIAETIANVIRNLF